MEIRPQFATVNQLAGVPLAAGSPGIDGSRANDGILLVVGLDNEQSLGTDLFENDHV